ncbi:MAG: DUF3857 domain-containing protein [Deltaproteobacteria bacterium]|nr:DUF3857 domain-containing protein [Deltaproteobacteria bacterium]
MRASPLIVALLLVVAGCKTASAPRGDAPQAAPAPVPTQAPASAASEGEGSTWTMPVEVIEERLRFSYDAEGRRVVQRNLRYRILRMEDLEDWAQVFAFYRTGHQARPEIEATVRTSDGRVETLDPSTIGESAAGSDPELLDDGRILRAPLPALSKGAEVSYQVTIRDVSPFFSAGTVETVNLGFWKQAVPVEVTVELPVGAPFAYHQHGVAVAPMEREAEGRRTITFRYVPAPTVTERPWLLPAEQARGPELAFATGASWAEVARRYAAEVEPLIAGADGTVGPQLPAGAPRDEVVRALVAWLHAQVRYTGLEFGRGAIIPRAPAETLKRGYGDCKDKSVLLAAMLRARGIPAHVALVRSGDDPDVLPELPGVDAFNHMVVRIPGDAPLWVDATAERASVGSMPPSVQGRLSLVVRPDVTALEQVPYNAPGTDRYLERRVMHLTLGGPGRVAEHTEARGVLAERIRRNLLGVGQAEMEEKLAAYMKGAYGAERLSKIGVEGRGADAEVFELDLSADAADVGQVMTTQHELTLGAGPLFDWLPHILKVSDDEGPMSEQLDARTEPLALPVTYQAELIYEVHPPPGYVLRAVPRDRSVALGAGSTFTARFEERADGVVQVDFHFDTGARVRSAAEARALVAGLKKAMKSPAGALVFEHKGARLMAGGKDLEGLAEFQAQATQHPDSAFHRVELAAALVKLGLGSMARQEVEAAVALAPESAEIRHRAGWVFAHDLFGTLYGVGFAPVVAEQHYRAALDVKPDAYQTRINLALILRRDERGELFLSRDRSLLAAKEYDRLRDTPRWDEVAGDLMVSMLAGGDAAGVEALLEDLPPSADREAMQVLVAALQRGVEDAVSEAEGRSWGGGRREEVLEIAGGTAAMLRYYTEAEGLLSQAGRGAKDPGRFERTAAVYDKLSAGVLLWNDFPEEVRFLRDVFSYAAMHAAERVDFPGWLSIRASDPLMDEFLTGFVAGVQHARGRLEDAGYPSVVSADISWLDTHFFTSGSEAVGYRAEMVRDGKLQFIWYLVREGEQLRVRACSLTPAELGREALYHLSNGRIEAARTWLDWARADAVGDMWTLTQVRRRWKPEGEGEGERGPAEIREAAALLSSLGQRVPKDALKVLRKIYLEAKRDRPEMSSDYARMLFRGLVRAGQVQDALRLLAEERELERDLSVVEDRLAVRETAKAWVELERDARAVLGAVPSNTHAQMSLVRAAAHTGRLSEAQDTLREIADRLPKEVGPAFALLWAALLRGAVQPEDLARIAQRTEGPVFQRAYNQAEALGYAELGRPREAMNAVRRLARVRLVPELEPADRFVFGRVLEALGYTEAARAAYEATGADPDADLLARDYARARLARLPGGRPKIGAGKH